MFLPGIILADIWHSELPGENFFVSSFTMTPNEFQKFLHSNIVRNIVTLHKFYSRAEDSAVCDAGLSVAVATQQT